MRHRGDGIFERDDIWREGKWLDLWSVVHFLSGMSMAFITHLFSFSPLASFIIAFILLVTYEMWEAMVRIEETPQNRFMDVMVGMISFAPTFAFIAPTLAMPDYVLVFGVTFVVNVVLSVIGWRASEKAAQLEAHLRAEYLQQRARLIAHRKNRRSRRANRLKRI